MNKNSTLTLIYIYLGKVILHEYKISWNENNLRLYLYETQCISLNNGDKNSLSTCQNKY